MLIGLVAAIFFWIALPTDAGAVDDLRAGKAYFIESCALCHGTMPDDAVAEGPSRYLLRVMAPPFGPSLKGMFGRPAGTVAGFDYSKGFRRAAPGLVWDAPTLDAFLRNSRELVEGTIMFFKEPDPELRRQVIAYLEANR